MSLVTPQSVQKLQSVLHAKAKGSSGFRFYALYDKIYRADVLLFAYRTVRANAGSAGADGQTTSEIEAYGRERWLDELAEELRTKTYRAGLLRRVWIPKVNGGQRPLGIATMKDRVVQTAALLVLAPIFEVDLPAEQYAYRPGKSALDAVRRVHQLVSTGYNEVVDADLSGYFDSIPHRELMKTVARRISDGGVLHLVKMFLEMAVEEEDRRGRKRRTTRNKDEGRGTPQGSPISPLLSNLYMRRFVLSWKMLGFERRLQSQIVNYADDFVICCRGTGEEAMDAMRNIMSRLRLTINEEKTRLCQVEQTSFDFLGYTIGWCYSPRTGRAYMGTRPSKKKVAEICLEISRVTKRRWVCGEVQDLVGEINRKLRGWSNYFCLGPVSKAYRSVDRHTIERLRKWLRMKHKVQGQGTARYPDEYLYDKLGLLRLQMLTRSFPWAKA